MVSLNLNKRAPYKKKKGDALIDVIIGVSLIALIATGAHDAILNMMAQSEALFFLNRATWKASSEMEIISGLSFEERYELKGSETPLLGNYPEFTQIIEIDYLNIHAGEFPRIETTASVTGFQKIQIKIEHPSLGVPLVLERIIAQAP